MVKLLASAAAPGLSRGCRRETVDSAARRLEGSKTEETEELLASTAVVDE